MNAAKASATEHPLQYSIKHYKLMRLRETPVEQAICDTPEVLAKIWFETIPSLEWFDEEKECFVVFMLNTRRRVKGFSLVSQGTLDTILVHPRDVFRPAIVSAAAAIIVAHNHPSGDPSPSEADIKVTRDLVKAGQLLRIDVLDHVVIGSVGDGRARPWTSLRELGYFYS